MSLALIVLTKKLSMFKASNLASKSSLSSFAPIKTSSINLMFLMAKKSPVIFAFVIFAFLNSSEIPNVPISNLW
ncbi:Uncharacterised protein, partial [Mesomycoplasma hyorhinis]